MQKTDLLRFKSDTEKLWGIYRGVVEDRDDPLRLGRCRVRVMGVHTEEQAGDLNKVPYEELVWAHPVNPNFEGSISGSGAFCVPLQGSHVMVFFENGNMMQPRYFGSVPGFPVDAAKYSQLEQQDGFVDPDGIYPLDDYIEEHDWQRLSRVDKLSETYLLLKEDNLDLAVPIAFDGTAWDEQPPMYDSEYPDNNVFATHKDYKENIVIELDATDGKPRFAWWHPSKSYMEINFEGRMTMRNTFHRWDICDGIVHMHYMSYHFKTLDDTMVFLMEKDEFREIQGNRWTLIKGTDWRNVVGDSYEILESDEIVKISGNRDELIVGNETTQINADKYETVDVDLKELVSGNKESVIKGDMIKYIVGNYQRNVDGDIIDKTFGSNWRYVSVDDHLVVDGNKLTSIVGTSYEASDDDMKKESTAGSLYTAAAINNLVLSIVDAQLRAGNIASVVSQDTRITSLGDLELYGETGVNIGNTLVKIGPTVQLGVPAPAYPALDIEDITLDPAEEQDVTEPAAPPAPAEPIESETPPDPNIPEDPEPADHPVEMPEPGCP